MPLLGFIAAVTGVVAALLPWVAAAFLMLSVWSMLMWYLIVRPTPPETKRRYRPVHGKDGFLLVLDVALPAQPYLVAMPVGVLRERLGGLNELRMGRKSLWVARRDGDEVAPLSLQRDERTARTPEYMHEYMQLRADKDILARPSSRVEEMLHIGATVGVCVTTVAGLLLIVALAG